jgi:hypothetical protein
LAVESLGLDVAEEEEEESEKEDGPDVGFVIPSEAVVKKIKDQMRKTKDVREKMKIFFDAPSLRELYAPSLYPAYCSRYDRGLSDPQPPKPEYPKGSKKNQ